MSKLVLIRWLLRGCLNVNGKSYPRVPDEEDVVNQSHAKSLAVGGLVKIVGPTGEIPVVTSLPEPPDPEPVEGSEVPYTSPDGPIEDDQGFSDGTRATEGKFSFSPPYRGGREFSKS